MNEHIIMILNLLATSNLIEWTKDNKSLIQQFHDLLFNVSDLDQILAELDLDEVYLPGTDKYVNLIDGIENTINCTNIIDRFQSERN